MHELERLIVSLNQFSGDLPTWRTLSTQPDSSSLSPLQNDKFCCSPEEDEGTLEREEYMQMSLSLRGKDQQMILRCTGSGIRSYRSSIRWKGIFSATILAVMSSRVSGVILDCPTRGGTVTLLIWPHDTRYTGNIV